MKYIKLSKGPLYNRQGYPIPAEQQQIGNSFHPKHREQAIDLVRREGCDETCCQVRVMLSSYSQRVVSVYVTVRGDKLI